MRYTKHQLCNISYITILGMYVVQNTSVGLPIEHNIVLDKVYVNLWNPRDGAWQIMLFTKLRTNKGLKVGIQLFYIVPMRWRVQTQLVGPLKYYGSNSLLAIYLSSITSPTHTPTTKLVKCLSLARQDETPYR